jgi:hypothetical protein
MPTVTSDEALCLLRGVASGEFVPTLKNRFQHWDDETVEIFVNGWRMTIYTDSTRSRHLDTLASPDGRQGKFANWQSDAEFSQQPEDRLYREDNNAVNRLFQAFRGAL